MRHRVPRPKAEPKRKAKPKQTVMVPTGTRHPAYRHRSQVNPEGWRWRLVKWLVGGEITAVPYLPQRPIGTHEVVVLKLGEEGARNTLEVLSMVNDTTELVEIGDADKFYEMVAPDTFVAVDYIGSSTDTEPTRIVGWFDWWEEGGDTPVAHFVLASNGENFGLGLAAIQKAYWAPLGYRA